MCMPNTSANLIRAGPKDPHAECPHRRPHNKGQYNEQSLCWLLEIRRVRRDRPQASERPTPGFAPSRPRELRGRFALPSGGRARAGLRSRPGSTGAAQARRTAGPRRAEERRGRCARPGSEAGAGFRHARRPGIIPTSAPIPPDSSKKGVLILLREARGRANANRRPGAAPLRPRAAPAMRLDSAYSASPCTMQSTSPVLHGFEHGATDAAPPRGRAAAPYSRAHPKDNRRRRSKNRPKDSL